MKIDKNYFYITFKIVLTKIKNFLRKCVFRVARKLSKGASDKAFTDSGCWTCKM